MSGERASRGEEIVYFVDTYARSKGRSPSLREIGNAVGLSAVSAVKAQVDALVRGGRLTMDPRTPRSLRLAIPVDAIVIEVHGQRFGLSAEEAAEIARQIESQRAA